MKITVIAVGKTNSKELRSLVDDYARRIGHYIGFEYLEIPDLKKGGNWAEAEVRNREGQQILTRIKNSDTLILLDEKGNSLSSRGFAKFIQNHLNISTKHLVFVIGGAFGFSEELYTRANFKLSLSKMTFSHQMIRLFFLEQVYRAFTILRGEPYHND